MVRPFVVCVQGVSEPQTKERQGLGCLILETWGRRVQLGNHTYPVASGRGQSPILSCPPVETCPSSPSYLTLGCPQLRPSTTGQRAIFKEEKRTEIRGGGRLPVPRFTQVGGRSLPPSPGLVLPHRSVYLQIGARGHEKRTRL